MGERPLDELLDDAVVRRVRQLVADRQDVIVTLGDEAGRFRWASEPGSRHLFGRTPADVEGHTRFDYVHPDDEARVRRQHARALQGETVSYTIRARAADDGWVAITSVAWAVRAPWGQAILTITTADDPEELAWPRDAGQ